MLIDSVARLLDSTHALKGFWSLLDEKSDATMGVAASARPLLVAARFSRKPQTTLVVIAGEDAADVFASGLRSYLGLDAVIRFPDRLDFPKDDEEAEQRQDSVVIAQRARAMWALATNKKVVVVVSARALIRMLPAPGARAYLPVTLSVGEDVSETGKNGISSFEDVSKKLVQMGYENVGELDGPGSFCTLGGTLDVWSGESKFPVRIDFFGDEIDDIRRIVPSTGQTIASLESVRVFPVYEAAHTKNKASICSYAANTALLTLIEPRSLYDDMEHAWKKIVEAYSSKMSEVAQYFFETNKVDFGGMQRATYVSIMRIGGTIDDELPVKRTNVAGSPEKLFGALQSYVSSGMAVILCVPNFRARKDLEFELSDRAIPFVESLDVLEEVLRDNDKHNANLSAEGQQPQVSQSAYHLDDKKSLKAATDAKHIKRGRVCITDADIPLGMVIPKAHLAIISINDIRKSSASAAKHVDITDITFPYKPGDYVVHSQHGIALFKDLVHREIDGTARDYLLLEYAEEDRLFVPVEQLDRVTRYVGPQGASPRLTRLNTADWSSALRKARKATKKLAFDLVDVYSRRLSAKGYPFSADTPWQHEMESAFPYQETPDQVSALADIKADMEAEKPMDRLLCGDVGFGKTELALRAAFKATQDGKQVMVLCPTTVLAQQHYITFSERCAPFDIRVEVLSRFRTPAQQKDALEGFAKGTVDILIGTHRLLSRDVNPHDLGLVIIDEEQRFGVGHKEQFKNLRESVDILTLSATPIPRTLQMSMSGVRDMSLIMTPPDERRPIKVHVGEWDPDLVSAAIRRELARKGQVYYVSNRVKNIEEARKRVEVAAPEARVGIAHGQMSKVELEHVMEDFSAGEIDVLVATTIIESGLDNPHANTLIIEDSQRLGLAQMYQLKGRVGRSSTQAYAFFMFPPNERLTEEAQARLLAIDEHTNLGSGLRIAMRDLEIRGAGSILGAEQSGNMSAVGFDLFAQMLATALNSAKEGNLDISEVIESLSDITVNIPGKAYLPDDYIVDTDERVLWYRKIANAATPEIVDKIHEEILATYPEEPQPAAQLFAKAAIKAMAHERHIKTISVTGGKLVVEPIRLEREQRIPFKRAGARYVEESGKLSLPLKYFKLPKDAALFAPISDFIASL